MRSERKNQFAPTMRIFRTLISLRVLPPALSVLWVGGLLAGIGLFLRALRFVGLLPAENHWGSLVWVVPALVAFSWIALALLSFRATRALVPLRVLVLTGLPFLPFAVLGFLHHPPFHMGIGLLTEISEIIHLVRGGRVALGTIVALTIYFHALIGSASLRYARGGHSCRTALGEGATILLPTVIAGALLVLGLMQAMTYISIAFDDQVRYWSVADALARGQGYPLRTFDQEFANSLGEVPYWTDDLPVWPFTMLIGFALFGHTTAGSYAPLIAANVLLPLVAFLAVRNISGNLVLAFGAAVTLVLFPMYQIYALGAAEPEPLFHLLLLAMIACVPKARLWQHWVLFGIVTGLVVMTRPEGGIYAALALVVLLATRWREVGVWVAAVLAAIPSLIYAGMTWLQTGKPWPLQRTTYFALENLAQHWQGFATVGAEYYSAQLRTTTTGFWLVVGTALLLFIWGAVWLALQRPVFLFLPLAAGAHVLLLWLTEAGPALSNVGNPPDFFRHMSHALPYAWITVSLGIFALVWPKRHLWRQWLLVIIFGLGTYYSYQVLITPEATYGSASILLPSSGRFSLLKADTYVLAQDLFAHPHELPEIPHAWRDGVLSMQPWDYLGFRASVFEHYRLFDMHRADVGKPYMMASLYASFIAYITLALAALVGSVERPEATKRWWRRGSATPSQ